MFSPKNLIDFFVERWACSFAMKTKNSLKYLSKLELLELLAEQEREIQDLTEQLEYKNRIIEQRTLCMMEAGNIAQAALALNGVFEAAQKAADQYLESVKKLSDKNLIKDSTMVTSSPSSPQTQDINPNPSEVDLALQRSAPFDHKQEGKR